MVPICDVTCNVDEVCRLIRVDVDVLSHNTLAGMRYGQDVGGRGPCRPGVWLAVVHEWRTYLREVVGIVRTNDWHEGVRCACQREVEWSQATARNTD